MLETENLRVVDSDGDATIVCRVWGRIDCLEHHCDADGFFGNCSWNLGGGLKDSGPLLGLGYLVDTKKNRVQACASMMNLCDVIRFWKTIESE